MIFTAHVKLKNALTKIAHHILVAKMSGPNFRVLSNFRKDNAEFSHDCSKQTAKLATELKLASLEHISLDESKFKANPRAIKRETLKDFVLDALRNHLMRDDLTDIFCQEYTRHMNTLISAQHADAKRYRREKAKTDKYHLGHQGRRTCGHDQG